MIQQPPSSTRTDTLFPDTTLFRSAGALALVAARAGASVLATDFSFGMVSAILAHRLAGLEAEVMDGHALDLPDGGFDAAFSMFGIMLFADWRKGLAEMARVVHPGDRKSTRLNSSH